jgi:hypothetical protein
MNELETGIPVRPTDGARSQDEPLRERAGSTLDAGKQKAKELASKAGDEAISRADGVRDDLHRKLTGMADRLDSLANEGDNQDFAGIARLGSRMMRRASGALEGQSAEDLLRRARSEMQERPVAVVVGMAALGFFAVRLLKD